MTIEQLEQGNRIQYKLKRLRHFKFECILKNIEIVSDDEKLYIGDYPDIIDQIQSCISGKNHRTGKTVGGIMTEHDFQENADRYSEYRSLKQKLAFINGDIKGIEKDKIEKIQTDYGNINIEKYSEEAKNGLKEYFKTMMLAEIERVKKRMEEL